jgi:hypothetical protein
MGGVIRLESSELKDFGSIFERKLLIIYIYIENFGKFGGVIYA